MNPSTAGGRVRLYLPPLTLREAASTTIASMILSRSHEAHPSAAMAAMARTAYLRPRLKSSRPFPVGISFQKLVGPARWPLPFISTNGKDFSDGPNLRRGFSGFQWQLLKSGRMRLALPRDGVVARRLMNLARASITLDCEIDAALRIARLGCFGRLV